MKDNSEFSDIENTLILLMDGKSKSTEKNGIKIIKGKGPTRDGQECDSYISPRVMRGESVKDLHPKLPVTFCWKENESNYRLFTNSHEQLLDDVHNIIGDGVEHAFLCEDKIKWLRIKRRDSLPARWFTTAPKDRIIYDFHHREIFINGTEYYGKDIACWSPSTKTTYPIINSGYMLQHEQKDCKHYEEQLIIAASIHEDARCPYFFKVEIIHECGIVIYSTQEHLQELFTLRDGPTTPSGRKKPFIHWVMKHMRKKPVNKGFSQIPKHLRGITEFDIDEFNIRVIPPTLGF